MKVTDYEIMQFMIAGGRNLCDHALAQWTSGKYRTDENTRQENIIRWKTIKDKMNKQFFKDYHYEDKSRKS